MGMLAEFIGKAITRGTHPRSRRVSSLSHKAGYHAVECTVVVKPLTGKEHEIVDGYWHVLGEQLQRDIPLYRFNDGGVVLAGIDQYRWRR